jgi:hypothetical protein
MDVSMVISFGELPPASWPGLSQATQFSHQKELGRWREAGNDEGQCLGEKHTKTTA